MGWEQVGDLWERQELHASPLHQEAGPESHSWAGTHTWEVSAAGYLWQKPGAQARPVSRESLASLVFSLPQFPYQQNVGVGPSSGFLHGDGLVGEYL